MDNTSHTLPYLSSCPNTFGGYLPFPSSPHKICSNGSLLISADSLPSPPISLSPATAESIQSTSPLSHYTRSQCFKEQNIQGLSPEYASDQDDLTCLSWLHQRGNLLPLQPLSKMTLLPPLESSAPVQSVPSSSCKPPYSFTCMIFMAIEDSPNKRLPVKDIYEWIVNNFPYYKSASGGWRNSVRHNLSLSKSFHRIQRDKHQSVGKGSLWCVCPEYRPALLDLLKKTHKFQSNNCNLINKPALRLEAADYGMTSMCDTVDISESLSQTLLNTPSPQLTANDPNLCENPTCLLTPDHEELITVEPVEYKQEEAIVEMEMELELEMEKDPLLDSGYVELHYYQSDQYQYLVLPNDTQLDLETVEILQLDTEAQEAAGSLLDLADRILETSELCFSNSFKTMIT